MYFSLRPLNIEWLTLIFVCFKTLDIHCFQGHLEGTKFITQPEFDRSKHCANGIKIIGFFLTGPFSSALRFAARLCAPDLRSAQFFPFGQTGAPC